MGPADQDRVRYGHVREIFHRACELDPRERAKFLDQACAHDAEIRSEIESLFALERSELVGVLDLTGAGAPRVEASHGETERIGRYRLIELMGEGGFGAVYLAEQTEPVVRRVALKIIRAGRETPEVLARFDSERQTLAVMDHPHIAKLFDAGTSDAGRPFFVMELVEGEAVTSFCDRERYSVERRLEVFRVICGAVQHAHQKGVVHRDLKPSNVLISAANGRAEPKLIDFGIAEPSEQGEAGRTDLAEARQVIGTLQYMSPEQALGVRAQVDTRSDIYALGVLLYEILVGSTPLRMDRLRSSTFEEIQRRIREEEPELLSQRLLASSTEVPEAAYGEAGHSVIPSVADVAAKRGETAHSLLQIVRGDLEAIVLKCLQKDPEKRYPTSYALAEDVGRFLKHEPVLARPGSRSYRLRKFVRRHRESLILSALGVVVLVSAVVVSVMFALREARQRKVAERSEERAQAAEAASRVRAEELEQAVTFLQEFLATVDVVTMGQNLRVDLISKARIAAKDSRSESELESRLDDLKSLIGGSNFTGIALDSLKATIFKPALTAVDKKFRTQPLVHARLLQTLGLTLHELGILDLAHEPLRTALEIRRRELGVGHADTLTSTHELGRLLHSEGQLPEAERYLTEALEGYRRVLGNEHRSTLTALVSLGYLHRDRSEFAKAHECYREALEGQCRLLGETHVDALMTVNNIGALLLSAGKRAEAATYFQRAFEGYRAALGDNHPDTLMTRSNVAVVLQHEGRSAEAEHHHRGVLEARSTLLGDDHPDTLVSRNNLGFFLHDQGRFSEAEPYYREVLEKRQVLLGANHAKTLNSMNNLAGVLKDLGRLDEAEPLYREVLAMRRRNLRRDHPETMNSLHNLGWLLEGQGQRQEAEAHYREALDGYRHSLGDEHRDTLITIGNLGALLLADDRPAEALALLANAELALRRTFTGGLKVRLARNLLVLGRCHARSTDFESAESKLLEAHEILHTAQNATSRDRISVLTALTDLYDLWTSTDPDPRRAEAATTWRAKLESARAAPEDPAAKSR